MIATIIIISLALYWLMRETAWLTVRLPVGKSDAGTSTGIDILNRQLEPAEREYAKRQAIVSEEARRDAIMSSIKSSLSPNVKDILCGWKWVKLHLDIVPLCTFELRNNGNRQCMNFTNGKAVRGAVKSVMNIYTGKYRPPNYKTKPVTFRRNRLGGIIVKLPAGAR